MISNQYRIPSALEFVMITVDARHPVQAQYLIRINLRHLAARTFTGIIFSNL